MNTEQDSPFFFFFFFFFFFSLPISNAQV